MSVFVNTFEKGLITDLAKDKIQSGYFTKGRNVEILNNKGKGLIAVPIKGNSYSFSITEGYKAISYIKYNEKAFIFSVNSEGTCEIGMFPSPKSYTVDGDTINNTSLSGFETLYKPLCNYAWYPVDMQRRPLRTSLFGLNEYSDIKGFARQDNQGNIILYYTDGEKPIKRLETGINVDGTLADFADVRIDWNTSIEDLDLFVSKAHEMTLEFDELSSGGRLQYGGYYCFIRFVTNGFDRTGIIDTTGLIPVYKGIGNDIEGGNSDLTNERSSKAINLTLSGLNKTFSYVEIITLRYYSDTAGVPAYELNLIDKKYPIPQSGTTNIKITGYEDVLPFSLAELMSIYATDVVAKDIIEHHNYLWGINWKSRNRHNEILQNFAQIMRPEVIHDTIEDDAYKDEYYVNNKTGYFLSEAYPFSAQFVFKDGTLSEAYPVKGYDFIKDESNDKGIVRFPNVNDIDLETSDGDVVITGIKFSVETGEFNSEFTETEKEWLKTKIAGVKILRGERYKNLLYEGLSLGLYGLNDMEDTEWTIPVTEFMEGSGWLSYDKTLEGGNVSIPLIDEPQNPLSGIDPYAWLPMMNYGWTQPGQNPDNLPVRHVIYSAKQVERTEEEKKIVAIFSPDFLLSKNTSISNIGFVKKVGAYDNDYDPNWRYDIVPDKIYYYYLRDKSTSPQSYSVSEWEKVGEDYITDPVNHSPKLKCINRAYDSYTTPNDNQKLTDKPYSLYYEKHEIYGFDGFYDHICNRNLYVPKYIALKAEDNLPVRSVCALYQQNPDDIDVEEIFTTYNTEYFAISNLESLFTDDNIDVNIELYGGDCFVQRTYFKVMSWEPTESLGYNIDPSIEDDEDRWEPVDNNVNGFHGTPDQTLLDVFEWPTNYAHGKLVSIVTQNRVNTAYRETGDTSNFYPNIKDKTPDYRDFAFLPWADNYKKNWETINIAGFESFLYNMGYSVNSPLRVFYGVDLTTVFDNEYISSPTRMRYTAKNVPGAFFDNYRVQPPSSYQDFDRSKGEFNAIAKYRNFVLTAQDNAINQHYIDERKVRTPSSEGELIVGISDILSDYVKVLSNYGSYALKSTDSGIYGFDTKRGIPWKAAAQTSDRGYTYAGVSNLSAQLFVESWFKDYILSVNDDPTSDYFNDRENGRIVTINQDPNKHYVYFTLHNPTSFVPRGSNPEDIGKTFVFDEKRGAFLGESDFKPYIMFDINKSFVYACNIINKTDFYQSFQGVYLNFFGTTYPFELEFIVNGLRQERNESVTDKYFTSQVLNTNNIPPVMVDYDTLKQRAVKYPFQPFYKPWERAEYKDSEWYYSLPKQLNVGTGEYQRGSDLMGMWLTTRLVYKTNQYFYLSSVKTDYDLLIND